MPYKQDLQIPDDWQPPIPERDFAALFERVEKRFPIADSVQALEGRCQMAIELAGEILATLQLDGNAHLFAEFPDDWRVWVECWQKRYKELASK